MRAGHSLSASMSKRPTGPNKRPVTAQPSLPRGGEGMAAGQQKGDQSTHHCREQHQGGVAEDYAVSDAHVPSSSRDEKRGCLSEEL